MNLELVIIGLQHHFGTFVSLLRLRQLIDRLTESLHRLFLQGFRFSKRNSSCFVLFQRAQDCPDFSALLTANGLGVIAPVIFFPSYAQHSCAGVPTFCNDTNHTQTEAVLFTRATQMQT